MLTAQIALVINTVISLYTLLIFVWAILSWFNTGNAVVRDIYNALDKLVAPFVNLFRRFIPPLGGLDLSPFIALIVLQLLARAIIFILP
ncbi:MAG: YggT family protein [Coriobacteriales bacterium]|jgi:YggT family protein|nr:YggT family protein [Coriobacteriales bacterium]